MPYQESGQVRCIMSFNDGGNTLTLRFELPLYLHLNTAKLPETCTCIVASVCAYVCVCLKGGENQVSMNPGRISIPFVRPINNSERCSIGK